MVLKAFKSMNSASYMDFVTIIAQQFDAELGSQGNIKVLKTSWALPTFKQAKVQELTEFQLSIRGKNIGFLLPLRRLGQGLLYTE